MVQDGRGRRVSPVFFKERVNSMSGLATLTLARLYAQQGDPERAMGIYHQLLEAEPGNTHVMREMSELMDKWPSLDRNQGAPRRITALDREITLLREWLNRLTGEEKTHDI